MLGGYYAQAINKNAPHPAAARLWEEFLYSQAADGGQNLWLQGGARPVEQLTMANNGSIDNAAAASSCRRSPARRCSCPGPGTNAAQLPGRQLGEGRQVSDGRLWPSLRRLRPAPGPFGPGAGFGLAWIGTVPFLGYVGVFLLLPTGIVIWNAIRNPTSGELDLARPQAARQLRGAQLLRRLAAAGR